MSALYTPESLNIKAPAGGFSQGGWYASRQFWDGKLGDPGVIINPTQQGYQSPVSNEVVAQTNPANVAYIKQQQAQQQNSNVKPSGQTAPVAPVQTPSPSLGGAGLLSSVTTPTIDLPGLYKSLSTEAGISDIEQRITEKTAGFNAAQSKINDNPYLSEADRVGRLQKLSTDFSNDIKKDTDSLAMKKADVEMRLNLASKQYDIESEAARQALDKFNSLLSMGALDGANGEDIASITRSTGLSSSMIQNAINYTKDKNTPTSTIQYDDGTNQGFAVINSKTGEIISRQVIAGSKPKTSTATGRADNKSSQANEANTKIIQYTQDKAAQAAASPEDYIVLLMQKYPLAGLTLDDAKKIRKATGQ